MHSIVDLDCQPYNCVCISGFPRSTGQTCRKASQVHCEIMLSTVSSRTSSSRGPFEWVSFLAQVLGQEDKAIVHKWLRPINVQLFFLFTVQDVSLMSFKDHGDAFILSFLCLHSWLGSCSTICWPGLQTHWWIMCIITLSHVLSCWVPDVKIDFWQS